MLRRARQDQEHQKPLERVGQLLDRAITQVDREHRAGTLRGLLKDARLELARLEDAMGAASPEGGGEVLDRS